MGKAAARKRSTRKNSDPAMDYLAMFDARNMMLGEILSMGWKLAAMVLIPIFVGVQIDKKFDSAPSATLAAFFIAIFGAGLMIYKTYNQLNMQAAQDTARSKSAVQRSKKNVKRSKNA